jgi:hypothetical protein
VLYYNELKIILKEIYSNMINIKKTALGIMAGMILAASLSGCQSKDKSAVSETAGNFLEAVRENDKDAINTYSSGEVATGSFVSLFDGDYLKEQLTSSLDDTELTDETLDKLDEFYANYETTLQEYKINDVVINDDGSATVYATMKTNFPIDVTTSEDIQKKIQAASEKYNEENMDEILKVKDEEGDEAAIAKAYNDLIIITMNIYEEAIALSKPETYSIAITLLKNEETDTYYVTSVQSYDSSIAGTGAPATDTDTSNTESSEKSSD